MADKHSKNHLNNELRSTPSCYRTDYVPHSTQDWVKFLLQNFSPEIHEYQLSSGIVQLAKSSALLLIPTDTKSSMIYYQTALQIFRYPRDLPLSVSYVSKNVKRISYAIFFFFAQIRNSHVVQKVSNSGICWYPPVRILSHWNLHFEGEDELI